MKKIKNKKGIVFWVTGLSGSGKTAIAKKIKNKIIKYFGPTVLINGDDLRNIYNLKKYTRSERIKIGKGHGKLCKFFSDQKLNVIFSAVGLFDEIRNFNRKNIKNYIEIYIKSKIKKIKNKRKKKIYFSNKKNLMGIDIKPEFPKRPHIIISNDFNRSIEELGNELIIKIKKKYVFR